MGSFLRITLVCDYEDQFILREIIRMLNEDNIEVKSVHSSLTSATSSLHVLNAEVLTVLPRILNFPLFFSSSLHQFTKSIVVSLFMQIQQSYNLGTSVLIERLKIFVNGHWQTENTDFPIWKQVTCNTVQMLPVYICLFGIYTSNHVTRITQPNNFDL